MTDEDPIAIRPIEEPKHPQRMLRCTKIITTSGLHKLNKNQQQCGRGARFNYSGELLCTQHAGEKALNYVIDEVSE